MLYPAVGALFRSVFLTLPRRKLPLHHSTISTSRLGGQVTNTKAMNWRSHNETPKSFGTNSTFQRRKFRRALSAPLVEQVHQKQPYGMLGGRKTVICEFLGTGMISVMPVPLLSVHPRECSPQGHIRYVPSVCACRWTYPVPPHKPPLQAL